MLDSSKSFLYGQKATFRAFPSRKNGTQPQYFIFYTLKKSSEAFLLLRRASRANAGLLLARQQALRRILASEGIQNAPKRFLDAPLSIKVLLPSHMACGASHKSVKWASYAVQNVHIGPIMTNTHTLTDTLEHTIKSPPPNSLPPLPPRPYNIWF